MTGMQLNYTGHGSILYCAVLYMPELPRWVYRSAHTLHVSFYLLENDA